MWFGFLRKIFFTAITVLVLSVISYLILLRDPLNQSDSGLWYGYWHYVRELFQGHLGVSYHTGEPLLRQILTIFPVTLSLCLAAMGVSLLLGIPLGLFALIQQENLLGKFLISLGTLSFAIPVFWLGLVWLAYASLNGWAVSAIGELHPVYDISTLTGVKILDIFWSDSLYKFEMMQNALQHLLLPTIILVIPATLEIMRLTHKQAGYVLAQNYVKVARARGWAPCKIWWNLVFRNTFPPLIPMIAHTFTLIFAFGMLIENIFSWGGIGRWLINALSIQDYHAISVGVMAIGLFVLLIDLLAGLIMLLLDPEQKKDWYNAA